MLKISEIFLSIQGESSYCGLPCIFIRLAGCNLRCNYCDTQYSYNEFIQMPVNEIIKKIKTYEPIKLVEITGGEPLIQAESIDLMKSLIQDQYEILLETNGSILMDKVPKKVHKIMDIKCPGSDAGDSFHHENLRFLSSSRDEIKFVLSSRDDYLWSKNIIKELKLEKYKLLFSVVFNRLSPKDVVSWIIKDKLPVRFQLQLHKYIWDPNQRGV